MRQFYGTPFLARAQEKGEHNIGCQTLSGPLPRSGSPAREENGPQRQANYIGAVKNESSAIAL